VVRGESGVSSGAGLLRGPARPGVTGVSGLSGGPGLLRGTGILRALARPGVTVVACVAGRSAIATSRDVRGPAAAGAGFGSGNLVSSHALVT